MDYKFKARPGSHISQEDAKIVGPVLQGLADQNRLTARNVVDEAKPEDSVLHKHFEWDESIAAQKFNEQQARNLINAVEIIIVDDRKPESSISVPAYTVKINQPVKEEDDPPNTREYGFVPVVMVTEGEAQVEKAMNDLKSWKKRYENFVELYDVFKTKFSGIMTEIDKLAE